MPAIILDSKSQISTDPIRNFKFQVNITPPPGIKAAANLAPITSLGFTSLSGLAVTTESIPYRQGKFWSR